ncbi:MAG: bifunctional UDP-N-acetylglucosamine diphosphorylase/glucosamine-1-phosphate N-acetyltransferase GlmU [Actinomycetota bacterium]
MASRQPPRSLVAVVLTAGKGKRMRSATPKVLHEVSGRPSLWYVLKAALASRPGSIVIVVGNGKERVEEAVRSWKIKPEPMFVKQGQPLGTAHAVLAAEDAVGDADDVLVLPGDDPLVTSDDIRALRRTHNRTAAAASTLITEVDNPRGYARVVREGDRLIRFTPEEVADASRQLRGIKEVSTLVYLLRREDLYRALPKVDRENRQREYYLPDVIPILLEKGERVSVVPTDWGGAMGLNSRGGLAAATRVMRQRILERHMANGVTFVDPDTSYVDADVRIGSDTVIQPSTFLQGNTRIGARCSIGPYARIVDSTVEDESEVTFAVLREARIRARASVGPFASIRPGTVLDEGAKAGSFVEIKASRIGKGSKVPHLSYVGDATLGRDVNIGAGTVTANYDGFDKHATVIGDEVHVGSDTMLIAPVKVGKRAWTGAGSVITKDVPAGALAVERTDQRVVLGYDQRKRAARARQQGKAAGKTTGKGRGGRRG